MRSPAIMSSTHHRSSTSIPSTSSPPACRGRRYAAALHYRRRCRGLGHDHGVGLIPSLFVRRRRWPGQRGVCCVLLAAAAIVTKKSGGWRAQTRKIGIQGLYVYGVDDIQHTTLSQVHSTRARNRIHSRRSRGLLFLRCNDVPLKSIRH